MRRETKSMAIGAIVMACFLAIGVVFSQRGPHLPPDFEPGTQGAAVTVDVVAGASGSDIAKILVEKGVVESFEAFFAEAVTNPKSSKIAPGAHSIHTHIPAKQALAELLDPKRISNLIRITEGAWTSEILLQMEKNGFSRQDLRDALQRLDLPSGISGSEGFLFPAQYSFGSSTSALTALQSMVARFSKAAQVAGISKGTSEFTPMQLLTIASLIQAEGNTQDFTKISQVIRNRLRIGMPLQFDSTVHYIKGTRGQVFLSTDSTTIDSPFNTYKHYGLPPGPIGNPGLKSMQAAINPEAGDWLYFITVSPGDTRFTSSNEQFLTWKSLYQKNLRDGAFGAKK
jgi:UPF0755 protein